MKEFIAVTDEYLYLAPDIFSHLVPYQVDQPCRRLACDPLVITPADLQVSDFPQPSIIQSNKNHHGFTASDNNPSNISREGENP